MALSFEDRRKIRKELPYGSLSNIAKGLNISRVSVSKYFSGNSNSNRIEKEVVDIYIKYKSELERIKAIVNG